MALTPELSGRLATLSEPLYTEYVQYLVPAECVDRISFILLGFRLIDIFINKKTYMFIHILKQQPTIL